MSKEDGRQEPSNEEATGPCTDVKDGWQSRPVDIHSTTVVTGMRGGGRSPGYRSQGGGGFHKRGGYYQQSRGGSRRYSGEQRFGESPPLSRGGSSRGGRYGPSSHPGGYHHHPVNSGRGTPPGSKSSVHQFDGSGGMNNGQSQKGRNTTNGVPYTSNRPIATPPPPPPAKASSSSPAAVTDGWQYKDPEDDIHGPYPASKIVNWVDKGYFSEGLPVRKVTTGGMGAWTTLKFVLIDMRREAALTSSPSPSQAHSVGVTSASDSPRFDGRARENNQEEEDKKNINEPQATASPATLVKKPPPPPAKVPEASPSDMAPSPQLARQDTGRSTGKWERDSRGSRSRLGADRWGADDAKQQTRLQRPGGKSFNNHVDSRGGRGRGSGDRGGRSKGRGGGRGGGRGRGFSTDPDVADAVCKLFTGDVEQGAEQPMWRYIDYEGATQGPFPAKTMIDWFEGGYLADSAIQVCGTERKVSPPNLPPPEFYMPLGALIYWVRRGHHFKPITVTDIQSKTLPEELATLKESAAKAFEGVNKEKETAAKIPSSSSAREKGTPTTEKRDERPTTGVRNEISWAEADEMEIIGFDQDDTSDPSANDLEKSLEQVTIQDE